MANTPEWKRAELSCINAHTNSRSLARILRYVSLRGTLQGHALLSARTVDLIFNEQVRGRDLISGADMRFGIGYALAPSQPFPWLPPGRICYWANPGGSFVIMDLDRSLTIAYTTNKIMPSHQDPRPEAFVTKIYEAVAGIEAERRMYEV
ncbi:hypothetical protein E4U41_004423 [Claviceps citrina]|nr:hypothetical protein E4U41_004423 [Claviceps citrina]